MKKTLLTLIAASAVIFSFVGCNNAAGKPIDNDSKSWKGQTPVDTDTEKGKVVLFIDSGVTPNWYTWTDIYGQVIEESLISVNKTSTAWTFTIDQNLFLQIDENESLSTENLVLYIGANENTEKDYRGRICVYRDKKVEVHTAKAPETIEPVGIVSIENDEPTSNSMYPDGNYTITEIWPISPIGEDAVGQKYSVVDTMKFKDLDIQSGKTIKFPVKAGETVIALYQPKRNKLSTKNTQNATYNTTNHPDATTIVFDKTFSDGKSRAEVYGFASKINSKWISSAGESINPAYEQNVIELFKDANKKCLFGKKYTITKHTDNVTIKSSGISDFLYYHGLSSKEVTRWKAAYADYVTDLELLEGSFEK